MKAIKMFGFAAAAALMAMAMLGASSAMAEIETALCKVDPQRDYNPPQLACKSADLISHVHEETLSGTKAKLLTSILTVECTVLFLGDVLKDATTGTYLSTPPTPLVIHGHFTYTNCGGCTVEEVSADALIKVLKLGHESADVTGEAEVHVNCSGLNCYYNGKGLKGEAVGPLLSIHLNGEVELQEQEVNKVKGLFCPATGKLDITTVPLPSHVYIAS